MTNRISNGGTLREVNRYLDASQKLIEQYFDPIWLAASEPEETSLLIGIFYKYINHNTTTTELRTFEPILSVPPGQLTGYLESTICSISAFWNYGEMLQTPTENLDRFTQTAHMSEMGHNGTRKIIIDASGLDKIMDADYHASVLRSVNYQITLAATFALAITDIPNDGKNWTAETTEKDDPMTMIWTVIQHGYGYSTSSNSVRLAMTVIALYCFTTILYLAYILITGTTSTAWHSAIELVALALQSKTPDDLGNISVGIDCLDTFNKSVGVRVNAEDKLELVFAGDRDFEKRGMRKIERNKEY